MNQFTSLQNILKASQVVTDRVELLTYENDATNTRGHPQAVVFPESTEDIQKILAWAFQNQVPIIPRGAGTGLSGGAIAENGGVIVEFSRLNHILDLDATGRSAVVEPGVVNLKLDEFVKTAGLYYPPDPASGRSATIGGNIAENAGGPHCFKYGVTTNYITGLDVVMADGQLITFGGKAYDYPEYDFCGLMTGCEGTLGVIARADVRLMRNPPAVKTLLAAFNNVEDAGNAVSAMILRGLVPSTMEMMDQKMMGIIEDFVHAGLPVEAGAALIIEVDGFPESLDAQMNEVTAALEANKAWGLRLAKTTEERDLIWYGRKSAVGAMARLSPAYLLLDGTVPRSKLATALALINQTCNELSLRVAYVFHAGDGNLHPFILIDDPDNPALIAKVHLAGRKVMEICLSLNGSITGEHGVGIEKRAFLPIMYRKTEIQVMEMVKEIFDPTNILNPGKIFPAKNEMAENTQAKFAEHTNTNINGTSQKETTDSLFINPDDLYVRTSGKTRLDELQSYLIQHNMWVPIVSPWPERNLAEIVGTNYNAPLRMRYGAIRDLILEMTVELPDGQTIHPGRPVVKNVAGYDLCKLFIGDYGTLGKLVDLSFKLVPVPQAQKTMLIPVDNLPDGIVISSLLLRICLCASALLLCKLGPEKWSNSPYAVLYTVEGHPQDVDAELTQVQTIIQEAKAKPGILLDGDSGSQTWANWILANSPSPEYHSAHTPLARIGIPPKDLSAYISSQATTLNQGSFYADIASGLIYTQGIDDITALRHPAIQAGGYAILLSAPDGFSEVDRFGYKPQSFKLMKMTKKRFDPYNRFNPGNFLV